jgi:hypothetical protein
MLLARLSDRLRELDAREGPVCIFLLRGPQPGAEWSLHVRQGLEPYTVERGFLGDPGGLSEDTSWRDLV